MNERPEDRELDPSNGEAAVETAQEFLEAEPSDDEEQVLTYGQLKEMLQAVFEQGILRGLPMGQDSALELINNDPEIDTETKEYITNLVKGGTN